MSYSKYVRMITKGINAETSVNPTLLILFPEQMVTYLESVQVTGI
jgi:hypothetical protein